jgi:penicillin-binding protein 2
MGLFKFFKNRFNILYIIISIIIIMLSFRLATLTIVEGSKYREISDVKRIRDIPIKSPRGKIYDRNGVILADNLTSFTVQIYKSKIKPANFNDTLFTLVKILDANGESLIDEFPIVLDSFFIKTKNASEAEKDDNTAGNVATQDTLQEESILLSPNEYIIKIIRDNKLIAEWLNGEAQIYGDKFTVKDKVLQFLQREYESFPLELVNGEIKFIDNTDELKEFLVSNKIDESISADALSEYLLDTEKRFFLNLFSNSKIRKYTYEFLNNKGLVADVELIDYSFIQDQRYDETKNSLMLAYKGITKESNAKEDFIYLIKNSLNVFNNLFNSVYFEDDTKVIPASILMNNLKAKYEDLPVELKEEEGKLLYEFSNEDAKQKYFNMLSLNDNATAYELIKSLALLYNAEVVDNIIIDSGIVYYAQQELLNSGINPNISVSTWEYTAIRDKNNWITNNQNDVNISAKELFEKLKNALELELKFEVNDYDTRNILIVKDRVEKQKYLSYHPIDICYNISDKTVAMVSERNHELNGVNIEIEPIRYYPEKTMAAHILGYLGKISQDYEIQDYLVKQKDKYSMDDIIGKAGVEEKFENYLAGQKGKKTVAVNNVGNMIESVAELAPVPGNDLYLTIDSRIQRKAEEVLEKGLKSIQSGEDYQSEWGSYKFFQGPFKNATSGAMVVLDVKNGETLALANFPSYDLNLFATGISTEDWNSLSTDSRDLLAPRPLLNIALQTSVQPGSTFKMITALAALEKGINPDAKIYCAGKLEIGQRQFGCWVYNMYGRSHGYQNLYQALQNSCNFYFYVSMLGENPVTGQRHGVQLSFEDVTDMATKFGLNDETGIEIDIPREESGHVPNTESKIANTKLSLRLYLEENLHGFVNDDYEMSAEELSKAIKIIPDWINESPQLTRGEVYKRLKELNFNPDKTYKSRVPLADLIKYDYINDSIWKTGDSLNISIGQGDNSYTPIQMANYVASLVNGGYKNDVTVVDKIVKYGEAEPIRFERKSERIELNNYENLEYIKQGMGLVAADSAVFKILGVKIGAKTGTAQKQGINPETGEKYDDFGWYVAYAPFDDPQIAVVCVLFQGGTGTYASPMIRDVIAEYLVINGLLQRPVVETEESNP